MTLGVVTGVVLAWNASLNQFWIIASIVLITIAGLGGVAIENRWIAKLRRAQGNTFATAIWLSIVWLMTEKPI